MVILLLLRLGIDEELVALLGNYSPVSIIVALECLVLIKVLYFSYDLELDLLTYGNQQNSTQFRKLVML